MHIVAMGGHYGQKLNRIPDQAEEDDHQVECGVESELDELGYILNGNARCKREEIQTVDRPS